MASPEVRDAVLAALSRISRDEEISDFDRAFQVFARSLSAVEDDAELHEAVGSALDALTSRHRAEVQNILRTYADRAGRYG